MAGNLYWLAGGVIRRARSRLGSIRSLADGTRWRSGGAGVPPWLVLAVSVILFLFAVRLLGTATDALAPTLEAPLRRIVRGDLPALGAGWLASYLLGNGSVIAALALSLFDAGVLTRSQLFMMVAGSRLGAAGIVVFVGALDYAHNRRDRLGESMGLGLLAFLLTYTIYLPATAVGYVSVPWFRPLLPAVGGGMGSPDVIGALAAWLLDQVGALAVFAVAVGLLFGSLRLFDRGLGGLDTGTIRRRYFRGLSSPWISFATGLLVTAATTSVAFSVGLLVPLYNRDYVGRREAVPYVLGANIGTLVDTLAVAAVLGTAEGTVVVVLLVAVATAATGLALAGYGRYYAGVAAVHDRVVGDRRVLVAFLAVLVALPLGLLLVR